MNLKTKKIYIESNNQYHRRNNIEIAGIPNEINDGILEEKVIYRCFEGNKRGYVTKKDIEACHRLLATRNDLNKRVIVRFLNRKIFENV